MGLSPGPTDHLYNSGRVALEIRNGEVQVTRAHSLLDECSRCDGIKTRAVDHEMFDGAELVELVPHVPDRSLFGQGISMLW